MSEQKVSLRGLAAKTPKAKDLDELKKKIKTSMLAPRKRDVIVGGDKKDANIEETKFKNPVLTGSMSIRYFSTEP
jgi:hypothetical protein